MSWSPSGNYMAIGNKSDNLAVFDVRTATMVKKKKIHLEVQPPLRVSFFPPTANGFEHACPAE